mmetsp:Transcript_27713/g.57451  ORF Transcript_27713/g.57451 Transcript_27713/m.57451 type:complete len:108 (-) Transcript_27713:366-689(-)
MGTVSEEYPSSAAENVSDPTDASSNPAFLLPRNRNRGVGVALRARTFPAEGRRSLPLLNMVLTLDLAEDAEDMDDTLSTSLASVSDIFLLMDIFDDPSVVLPSPTSS